MAQRMRWRRVEVAKNRDRMTRSLVPNRRAATRLPRKLSIDEARERLMARRTDA
jgi:hypothetical protein